MEEFFLIESRLLEESLLMEPCMGSAFLNKSFMGESKVCYELPSQVCTAAMFSMNYLEVTLLFFII
jgi:hypothetical protein